MSANAAVVAKGVGHRTLDAALWVAIGRLLARGLDVVMLVVLARLLSPADFGLIAIAMTFILLVEALLELPMVQALVRVDTITPRMFHTAFTLGLLRGVTVAAILSLLAWPVSLFYENPDLALLIPALAIAPIARGLISPRMVIFMKRLDFRYEFAVDLCSKVVALVVVVWVALATRSYWAIAAGTIAAPLAAVTLSYLIAPLRPRLTLADWGVFRDMVGWNSATQLVGAVSWQLDRLLLGRMVDLTTFGRYTVANDLSSIPQQVLVQPLIRPLMAAFANVQSAGGLRRAYAEATGGILLVGVPIFAALYALAEPIVLLALGRGWELAALILSYLALSSVMALPTATLPPLAMLLDKTRYVTFRMALELAVKVPLMVAGILYFGIWGAIAARMFSAVLAVATTMYLVRLLIGSSFAEQSAALVRPILAGLAMALVMWTLEGLRPPVEESIRLSIFLGLELAAGLLVYGTLAFLLWIAQGRPSGVERHVLTRVGMLARRIAGRR